MKAGSSQVGKQRTIWAATIAGYLALLALDVWLLVVLPNAAWEDRAAFVLQIVGLTSIATGFVAATELSKSFPALLDAMTSQNLRSSTAT